jgi:hypothetical protein
VPSQLVSSIWTFAETRQGCFRVCRLLTFGLAHLMEPSGCDSPGRLGPVVESRRPTQPGITAFDRDIDDLFCVHVHANLVSNVELPWCGISFSGTAQLYDSPADGIIYA